METIKAHGKFHAAHRQLDYDGKCAYVHGHTWRGTFVVRAERFPRLEKLDMSLDFGSLKGIFKFLDHKMLVSARDATFLNTDLFEPEGVVVIAGENPSVENVAAYCLDCAVGVLQGLFPGRGVEYRIEVTIQETDNNFFLAERRVEMGDRAGAGCMRRRRRRPRRCSATDRHARAPPRSPEPEDPRCSCVTSKSPSNQNT